MADETRLEPPLPNADDAGCRVARRTLLKGIAVAALPLSRAASAAEPIRAIAALERAHGGRLGVYAMDLPSGRTLAHRADERFRLQSSFKGLLTAMVLHRVAIGQETLAAQLSFGAEDLLPASPVTSRNVAAGRMTVGDLCAATMATSDNTAANLLMRRSGGPAAVTAFLRRIGDPVTRVDHYEGPALSGSSLPADSTTPEAVCRTLRTILLGDVLPLSQRALWERWMASNEVGRSRLRASFPRGWRSGDRTGTSDGVCNDYAFARRPGRAPLLVAAYYAAPGMLLSGQEAVLRDVGRIVVDWQR